MKLKLNGIVFSFIDSSNVKYNVYRKLASETSNSAYRDIATLDSTSFVNTGMKEGTKYDLYSKSISSRIRK